MKLKIHYRNEEVERLYENSGIRTTLSAGFDLVNEEDYFFEEMGKLYPIKLGVVIQPPEGYHTILLPRSSTFKKFGILLANSVGLIDSDYCGEEDYLIFPALYLKEEKTILPAGTRMCQILFQKTNQITKVEKFIPQSKSRGGYGSTGS